MSMKPTLFEALSIVAVIAQVNKRISKTKHEYLLDFHLVYSLIKLQITQVKASVKSELDLFNKTAIIDNSRFKELANKLRFNGKQAVSTFLTSVKETYDAVAKGQFKAGDMVNRWIAVFKWFKEFLEGWEISDHDINAFEDTARPCFENGYKTLIAIAEQEKKEEPKNKFKGEKNGNKSWFKSLTW